MKIGSKTFSLVLTALLLVAVVATNLQQVFAPRNCGGCVDHGDFVLWKQLTHEFEKNVINTIKEGPQPHLRELLTAYIDDVNKIFLGGPDTIPVLLQSYERDVTTIFDTQPPDPDKQVKDFRAVTHDFEKAVIGLTQPPEPE
jgi:hypothetical protein